MPQLNRSPWFASLALTWLVFLTIVSPKIISRVFPNTPTHQSTKKPGGKSWSWPWH
uniref:ATP synthase F0 subunit 8 n=1 Tax=Benthodesmus simonyi TaxID=499859 RepID=UPI0028FCBBF9|nr:ATP synthase F0 subunit 8 [Benthodesmus simonyi]WNH37929.1 ATP synthase F0 subunit 8 [Benthodesmus simonyi]